MSLCAVPAAAAAAQCRHRGSPSAAPAPGATHSAAIMHRQHQTNICRDNDPVQMPCLYRADSRRQRERFEYRMLHV